MTSRKKPAERSTSRTVAKRARNPVLRRDTERKQERKTDEHGLIKEEENTKQEMNTGGNHNKNAAVNEAGNAEKCLESNKEKKESRNLEGNQDSNFVKAKKRNPLRKGECHTDENLVTFFKETLDDTFLRKPGGENQCLEQLMSLVSCYGCKYCAFKTLNLGHFKDHVEETHQDVILNPQFLCICCRFTTNSFHRLTEHNQLQHPQNKDFRYCLTSVDGHMVLEQKMDEHEARTAEEGGEQTSNTSEGEQRDSNDKFQNTCMDRQIVQSEELTLYKPEEQTLDEAEEQTQVQSKEQPLDELEERTIGEPEERMMDGPEERTMDEPGERMMDEPEERTIGEPEERKIDEPEERTIGEPEERTIDEPEERTIDEPEERTIDEPEERTIDEPEERTIDEPEERTIDEPEERTMDEPEERTIDEPEERTIDEPEERTIDEPEERTIDEPEERTIDEPEERTMDEPEERTMDEPEERTMDEPEERTMDEPEERTMDEPEERTMDKPEERTMDEPEERTMDEPEERTMDEPEERTMDEPEERTIDEPEERTMDEPDGQTLDEPDKQTLDEPDVHTLDEPDEPEERTIHEPALLEQTINNCGSDKEMTLDESEEQTLATDKNHISEDDDNISSIETTEGLADSFLETTNSHGRVEEICAVSVNGTVILPDTSVLHNSPHVSPMLQRPTNFNCIPKVAVPLHTARYNPLLDDNATLIASFSRFPYPTHAELSWLTAASKHPEEQIRVWFTTQRLKQGITWAPEEVEEARKKMFNGSVPAVQGVFSLSKAMVHTTTVELVKHEGTTLSPPTNALKRPLIMAASGPDPKRPVMAVAPNPGEKALMAPPHMPLKLTLDSKWSTADDVKLTPVPLVTPVLNFQKSKVGQSIPNNSKTRPFVSMPSMVFPESLTRPMIAPPPFYTPHFKSNILVPRANDKVPISLPNGILPSSVPLVPPQVRRPAVIQSLQQNEANKMSYNGKWTEPLEDSKSDFQKKAQVLTQFPLLERMKGKTSDQLKVLEENFLKNSFPTHNDVETLASSTQLSPIEIDSWFGERRALRDNLEQALLNSMGSKRNGLSLLSNGPSVTSDESSVPNEGPSVPNEGPSVPNHGSSVPNHGPGVPNHGPGVPNHGSSVPNHGPGVPNHGPGVPNHGSSVPNHGSRVPNHGPSVPNHGPRVPNHGPRVPKPNFPNGSNVFNSFPTNFLNCSNVPGSHGHSVSSPNANGPGVNDPGHYGPNSDGPVQHGPGANSPIANSFGHDGPVTDGHYNSVPRPMEKTLQNGTHKPLVHVGLSIFRGPEEQVAPRWSFIDNFRWFRSDIIGGKAGSILPNPELIGGGPGVQEAEANWFKKTLNVPPHDLFNERFSERFNRGGAGAAAMLERWMDHRHDPSES